MTPPNPGPRGYVFQRDARPQHGLGLEELHRRFIRSLPPIYTPIGYNTGKRKPSRNKAKRKSKKSSPPEPEPEPEPQPQEPRSSPSPNPTAAPETTWEGVGALPLIVPQIVRSQCSNTCPGTHEKDAPKCGFRFVSEKKYQAHWMAAHDFRYNAIRTLIKQGRLGKDNYYLPRTRPERQPYDGVMAKKVTDGPDREMLYLTELKREGRLSKFDLREDLCYSDMR